MADEPKVRARRYRLHKSGDHSMCQRGCTQRASGTAVAAVTPPVLTSVTVTSLDPVTPDAATEHQPGRIETLALSFVSTLPYPVTDPRSLIGQMAVELARRIDQSGAAPASIRELRVMLMQLAEAPNGPSGIVDEARLRHHQQQLDALLAVA